ncbi:AraC family transcriptional regulator [Paenibacillus albus]|uniref:AraC family transcriptional regulator n=1 Tax=Paenibacillus albus TaxID=2495582 RepID=A0A3S9A236_9BACL|nr:AraC family transcriptional regulator [Paenibacillus albus]AZN39756.1 AraC family transcriptional regulator [Paenibacillus albus]
MKPIRKPFSFDPLFPFDFVYQGVRYTANELPDHLHDMYEIVYVHSGKGTFFIDNALYEKSAGDLFLIPGNTVHRSFPSDSEPIVSTALFFAPALVQRGSLGDGYEPLRCFDIARKTKQYKVERSEQTEHMISTVLAGMAEELQAGAIGYRHSVTMQLQLLLLELNRQPSTRSTASAKAGIGPQWIHRALRTIDQDPVQCGGLRELSGNACVSSAHFSRVFKQLTGMNVTDYVNAKRLIRAKELLLASDESIETVALACGFQGLPHFYQSFKKLTGMTPRSYRRQPLITN